MKFCAAVRPIPLFIAGSILLTGCGRESAETSLKAIAVTNADCGVSLATSGNSAAVAAKALAFRDLLGPDQKAEAELPFTRENAIKWSNLPVVAVKRVGVKFADMSPAQANAAQDLIRTAVSACGVKMTEDIRIADEYIKPVVPFYGWGSDTYSVGFLGQPSTTAPWMLKIGGHHLAYNLTFNSRLPGATPQFNGIEPMHFAVGGVEREPMKRQSDAMTALAQGIAGYPQARLAGVYTDITKGVEARIENGNHLIGGYDTAFPSQYPTGTTGRGVPYLTLTKAQQRLVQAAIASFTELNNNDLVKPLLVSYSEPSALKDTYIGFSGTPDLATAQSYVRIDGPRLWIELVLQAGVAYPDKLHYHSIWRDKQADYGGEFNQ